MNNLIRVDKRSGIAYIGSKGKWIEIPESIINEFPDFNGDIVKETDEFEVWDIYKGDFDNIMKLLNCEEDINREN